MECKESLLLSLSRAKELIQQHHGSGGGDVLSFSNLASLVQQCGKHRAIAEARQVHDLIVESGLGNDRLLGNLLIQMYGRCGDMDSCRLALARIKSPNVFSWTIFIEALAQNGHLLEALEIFDRMPERNVVSWTTIVKAFCSHGRIGQAIRVFEKMPEKNVTTWNAILSGFAENGQQEEAIFLFWRMNLEGFKPDAITFIIALNATSRVARFSSKEEVVLLESVIESAGFAADVKIGNGLISLYGNCYCLEKAERIFQAMPEVDLVSWNSVLWVYARNSSLEKAKEFFDSMVEKDVVSWNTIISAYSHHIGNGGIALELFRKMCLSGTKPDYVTFVSLIDSFSDSKDLCFCREVQGRIFELGLGGDAVVGTALVNTYGKCGSVEDARRAFQELENPDVVAWSAMMAVFAQHGHGEEGLQTLGFMDLNGTAPSEVTLLSAVDACSSIGDFFKTKIIDRVVTEAGFSKRGALGNALIAMHGSCGNLHDAWQNFQEVTSNSRDIVPWNAMIGALSRNGHNNEAFRLFTTMNLEGLKPEAITVVSVLDSCSILHGKMVHASILETGLEKQVRVQNALIAMYSESGCLQEAKQVFDTIDNPNVVSWSTLIAAYAECGRKLEAFQVFQTMNLQGLLGTGIEFFVVMRQDLGIEPNADHYRCMADLLGRVGKLEQAEELLRSMPFEPTATAWTSLLACCRVAKDLERAQRISQVLLARNFRGTSSGPYVLLSNVSRS